MAPKTPRNKQTQKAVVTLHSFFTPSTTTKSDNAPLHTTKQTSRKFSSVPQQPIDVITIDSDDSDSQNVPPRTPVSAGKRKRDRRASGSSDIEFVDSEPKHSLKKRTTVESTTATSDSTLRQASSSSRNLEMKSSSLEEVIIFGEPSNLLSHLAPARSLNTPSIPQPARDASPEIDFGHMGPLLHPLECTKVENTAVDSFPRPSSTAQESSSVLVENVSQNDEWGLGDDETEQSTFQDDQFLDEPSVFLEGVGEFDHEDMNGIITGTALPPIEVSASDVPPKAPSSHAPQNDAFSFLMASRRENEAWKEAAILEDRSLQSAKRAGGRRKAPFYKVLQGMPIAVDAFQYGNIPLVTAYFLTHAHSDHYTNLSSSWKHGSIYCSEGTANLIIHMLSVDKKWVHPLPMDIPTLIPNTNGVHVTLIEANHCPGSCLFFFEGPQTVDAGDSAYKSQFVGSSRTFRYLHCGDFRACPRHVLHPAVKGKRVDHVYLDTTYLDPKYTFPPQPLVISACAELARRIEAKETTTEKRVPTMDAFMNPKTSGKQKAREERILYVVGTYSIGKERIVKAIAHALSTKVYCDARKRAILRCQADPELDALLTPDPLEACLHVVPLSMINSDKLKTYLDRFKDNYTRAVGFRPTGWTYTQTAGTDQSPTVSYIISRGQNRSFTYSNLNLARNSTHLVQLYPVPYSEHSSFYELTCFAMSLNWGKMIATVNVGSENSRGKMAKWVTRWEEERKKRAKDYVVVYQNPDYW